MRRPSYVPALAALAAVVLVAACADVGLLESLVNPLTLELEVPVDSMVPGDRVETAIIVRNRSGRTVQFHGGGCTFGVEVLGSDGSSLNRRRDGNPVPAGCADIQGVWTVPARDSLVVVAPWAGVSGRSPEPPYQLIGLPPGTYGLRPVIHAEEFSVAGPAASVTVLPWAYARLVHTLEGLPPLDLVVGGRTAASGIPSGSVSSVSLVPAGTQTVELRTTGQGATVARGDMVLLEGGANTIVVRVGPAGPEPWRLTDTAVVVDAGKSRLRLVHLAAQAPAITAYGGSPDNPVLLPVMLPFPYGAASPYLPSGAGPWTVIVTTLEGGRTLMHTAPMPIPGGQTRTLILLDGPGGVLTGALIDP